MSIYGYLGEENSRQEGKASAKVLGQENKKATGTGVERECVVGEEDRKTSWSLAWWTVLWLSLGMVGEPLRGHDQTIC